MLFWGALTPAVGLLSDGAHNLGEEKLTVGNKLTKNRITATPVRLRENHKGQALVGAIFFAVANSFDKISDFKI